MLAEIYFMKKLIEYYFSFFQKEKNLYFVFSLGFVIGFYLFYFAISENTNPNENSKAIEFSFGYILKKNSGVFLILLMGFLSVGILNIFTIFINGFIVGLAFNEFNSHFGLSKAILAFLPHGVLEVLVYVNLSSHIIYVSEFFLRDVFNDFNSPLFMIHFKIKSILLLYMLLILAAFIEVFITPIILN
jgi:stage II sporulation protein M